MFGPRLGTYYTYSESDNRFNHNWRKEGLVCAGIPDFIKEWLKSTAKTYDLDDYPDDVEVGFMKD